LGTVLWEPTAEAVGSANVTRYMDWLRRERGIALDGYDSLWQWSVGELEEFWRSIWDFYEVKASTPYGGAVLEPAMPGARWFAGARLNYAEHILSRATTEHPALIARGESSPLREISWATLRGQVGALAATLRAQGIGPGDRVAAYIGNLPEAVVAMLAVTSIGAVWTACAPDFGTHSVLDRFAQVEPSALIAVDGFRFGGREYDRMAAVRELQGGLPTATPRSWSVRCSRAASPRASCEPPVSTVWSKRHASRSSRSSSSTTRSGSCTHRARRASPRASCTAMGESWSST
jgi:acetoacetyl-CoA synthetase